MFSTVVGISFIKKHWKKISVIIIAFLMLPLVFASAFTVEKSVPDLDPDSMRIYIDAAENVGKGKTVIDWKNLIAIDAVRYNQDFSNANSSNVEELAKKFIKENKTETHYDFTKYKSCVDNYNSKNNTDLDYRDVVMVDSLLKNQNFSNENESSINNLIGKFVIKTKVPVEGLNVYDVETRDYESVLINLGYSKKDIPEYFKDENKIDTKMDKTTITYTTKSLDEVISEMGFTDEEKEDIKRYRDVGLNVTSESDNSNTDSGTQTNGDTAAFIAKISAKAIDTYKEYKVFPSITIAQGILESGSGATGLAKKANNLFGIKAYNWGGPCISMPTFEYYGSMKVQVMADFRVYSSWDDSVEDHGKFLVENSTYRNNGVFSSKDFIEQAYALKKAGYATDPNYPVMLINLIEQYGLNKYDVQ